MQFLPLPAYRGGTPLDFSPITNALEANRRNALAQRSMDMDQQRFGLQQGQFDLAKREADRNNANALAREAQYREFMANPSAIRDPATLAAIRMAGPDQAPNIILQGRNADLERARLAQSQQLTAAQIRQINAQLEQARSMTPDGRRTMLGQLGIDPRSPQGQSFILNGTYPVPGPTDELVRYLMPRAPGVPQTQPEAPRVIPQSYDNEQPNALYVPTQASGGGAPAPAAPPPSTINTPVGPMPEDQARRLGFGLALAGRGDAGKMINEAVDREKLGKEAANENDKRQLAAVEGLSRARLIAQGFKPEWLTIENKARQYGVSWLDSFETLRGRLPPETLKDHVEYTTFVRDAVSNLTQGIKEATGAAMGVQEEARIRKGLPDPEKDNPTAFAAKLRGTVRELELTVARTNFLRQNGWRGQPWRGTGADAERVLPTPQFNRMLNDRKNEIYRELRTQNPDASQEQLLPAVAGRLKQEFGI